MKKIQQTWILWTALVLPMSLPLQAEWGLKAGPLLSFAGEGSAIYNASNLFGARIGLYMTIPVNSFFFLQPEIAFSMKGGRYYSARQRSTESARLDYIEIPVLGNVILIKDRVEAYLGPYLGLLTGSTDIDEEHDWTGRGNELKNHDYGFSLGARIHVVKPVFLEMQFSQGLTDVVYDPEGASKSHKNKTLSMMIGFVF